MEVGFVIAVVCAAVWFATLLVAVKTRWLSRFQDGFRTTLAVSLISIAVWSSLLIAYWGYNSARQTLINDTDTNLKNVAQMVTQFVDATLKDAYEEAGLAATTLSPRIEREMEAGSAQLSDDVKKELGRFNTHFFGASITGGASAANAEVHPHYDAGNKKYLIDIKVPLAQPGHPPETFVVAYDIQRDLEELVGGITFGKTGYIVVVNEDGNIITHPDPSRIHQNISNYQAVQRVRAGDREDVPLQQRNSAGTMRLFAFRPVYLMHDPLPLTVMAEMDVAEMETPIRRLLGQFSIGFGILTVIAIMLGGQISLSIHHPIRTLLEMIERVKRGELSAKSEELGRDEIGRLGAALNDMTQALHDRDRIKELFGKYVTSQVSDEVLKGHVNLGGQSRRVTMLISDIRGFTAMSEQMQPEEVVQFLNAYFSDMVDAVFEYGGVLDKFLGDGLLAVYGSFDHASDHPRRAVLTALRMNARLIKINEGRVARGLAPIRIGIGIHTGEVIVGNIGSMKRLEYTVIGDGVNTTSRLESLNKEFSTMILISEETYNAVKDYFECRQMPETVIRGKKNAMQLYEVVGAKEAQEATVAGA